MARRKKNRQSNPSGDEEAGKGTGNVPPSQQLTGEDRSPPINAPTPREEPPSDSSRDMNADRETENITPLAGEAKTPPITAPVSREEPPSDLSSDKIADEGVGGVRNPPQLHKKRRSQRISAQQSKEKAKKDSSKRSTDKDAGTCIAVPSAQVSTPLKSTKGSEPSKSSQASRSSNKTGVKRSLSFTSPPRAKAKKGRTEHGANENAETSAQESESSAPSQASSSLKTAAKRSMTTTPPSSVAPKPRAETNLPIPVIIDILKTVLSKLEQQEEQEKKKRRYTYQLFENKEPKILESAEIGNPEKIKEFTLQLMKCSATTITPQIESDSDTGMERQKLSSPPPDAHLKETSQASHSTQAVAGAQKFAAEGNSSSVTPPVSREVPPSDPPPRDEKTDEEAIGVATSPQKLTRKRKRPGILAPLLEKKAKRGTLEQGTDNDTEACVAVPSAQEFQPLKIRIKRSLITTPPSNVAPEPSVEPQPPTYITIEMLKTALSKVEEDEKEKWRRACSLEDKEPEIPQSAQMRGAEDITERTGWPMELWKNKEERVFYVLGPIRGYDFIAKLIDKNVKADKYTFELLPHIVGNWFYFPREEDIRVYSSSMMKTSILAKERFLTTSTGQVMVEFENEDLDDFDFSPC